MQPIQPRPRARHRTLFAFLLCSFALSAVQVTDRSASAADGLPSLLDIREWSVPWENTRPRDPAVAPDGSIWFVGQVGHYVARLDPESGEMVRFEIPRAGPHTVVVDAGGTPWYAGNRDRHIGRLDPGTGDVRRIEMPAGVEDPHTMDWTSNGDLWFTAQRSGSIGRLTMATGEVEVVAVPDGGMRPYGLVVDADDRPWFTLMGANAIGTVDPESMELRLHETPDPGSRIRRIGLTSDGRVWWADATQGYLGVFDPADGSMKQWRSPGGQRSALYAMAVDAADRVWYVETGVSPNRFVGFDARSESFISIDEVPSGGGAVRHMVFDPARDAIWFGTDTHTIGRATVPAPDA